MGLLEKCPFCGKEVDTSYPHFLWVEANQGFSLSHACYDGDEHIASITIFGKTAEEVFQRWNDRIEEKG